jgi:hypothetical protein
MDGSNKLDIKNHSGLTEPNLRGGNGDSAKHKGPNNDQNTKPQPRFGGYGPPQDVIQAKYHRSSVNPDSERLSVPAES